MQKISIQLLKVGSLEDDFKTYTKYYHRFEKTDTKVRVKRIVRDDCWITIDEFDMNNVLSIVE